jgi:flagellar basal body-associated protein FliL
MDRITSAAAATLVVVIVLLTVSFMSIHTVFASSYENTQSESASQINECGNYWFPINVLCSNINSQTQGDANRIAVTSEQEDGNVESTNNLGAPFP